MKILSWNCRGLANTSTISSLRAIIRHNHPDVIFLSETKTAPDIASSILHQLDFSLLVQAPPSQTRGGLLLAWNSDVNISSFFVSNDMICVWCFSTMPHVKCMISFVYGPPYQKSASNFWCNLADCGFNSGVPWLCIGDFNAITSSLDKLGGRPVNSSLHNNFSNFLNTMGMIDLGFSGNPYTWSNHCQGLGLIKERLDRTLLLLTGFTPSQISLSLTYLLILLTTTLFC
jgi:hypothetical protein